MKHGKYESIPPASSRKKVLAVALTLLLLVSISTGVTLAYFAMSASPVINTFEEGSVGAEIVETVNGNTKEAICVKNTGKSPVYVRVRLVSYFEDAQDNVLAQDSPTVIFTPGENWVHIGDYYYYNAPLAADANTEDLLKTDITMKAGQVIEVLADTVQATPSQAVKDSWGVDASTFISQ